MNAIDKARVWSGLIARPFQSPAQRVAGSYIQKGILSVPRFDTVIRPKVRSKEIEQFKPRGDELISPKTVKTSVYVIGPRLPHERGTE